MGERKKKKEDSQNTITLTTAITHKKELVDLTRICELFL